MRWLSIIILASWWATASGASLEKPNVLMVVADDLGWGDLASNGNQEIETPHLDRLGDSGMNLEYFYVCPNGSATSASLLTGRYHYRTGVAGDSGTSAMMFGSENTLGELFAANGYRTAYFGRWHHGENWPHDPTGRGFDRFGGGGELTEQVISFCREAGPFFCLVKYPFPRLEGAEIGLPASAREDRILGKVKSLDREVGRLIQALENGGLRDRTIVIFLSDNGPDFFGERQGRYNGYFYGGRGSVHEGGVRVPCLVSWKGMIEEGSRFSRIVGVIDWYPTLVELCGLNLGSRQLGIDGVSLAKVLLSGGSREGWPNRILFTSWTPPGYDLKNASVAVRTDRWLALRDPNWRRDDSILDRQNGWELYDLKGDPFALHEQGDDYPYLIRDLVADFSFWMDRTTDDGIGPIAIEVGHENWPEVRLVANAEKKWLIEVVRGGRFRMRAEQPVKRDGRVRIGGEEVVPAEQPEIELAPGELTIEWISQTPDDEAGLTLERVTRD